MASIAQQDSLHSFSLGPTISYTFGSPLNVHRAIINRFGSSGLGTSYAHTFGAGAELDFASLFSHYIGLSLLGQYESSVGEFTSDGYTSSDNSLSTPGTQQFHLSSRYGTASLTGLAAYHLSPSVDVGLGSQMGLRVQNALTDWREILTPSGATFTNGSTRDTVATGSAISSGAFRVAIPAFVGYSVSLGGGIALKTRLFGLADITEILAGYAGESFSAGISVSLLFGTSSSNASRNAAIAPKPIQRSVIVSSKDSIVAKPVSADHIHASIHLEINGVTARSATVREVDTLIEEYTVTPGKMHIPKAESRLIRSYIVPDLSASRFVESEAGIRGWSVRMTQAGRMLAEYSNLDSTQSNARSAAIELRSSDGKESAHPAPIVAELTVTDAHGAVRSVSDSLELVTNVDRVASRIHKQEYLFLKPATAELHHQDSLLLRNLISSLDTGGTLTIAPLKSGPQMEVCSDRDSLSSWVLTAVRHSVLRPHVIELRNEPVDLSSRLSSSPKHSDCGIIVRYDRER
ncbi:MAG: hypothetical protein Q8921_00605 [Bacteroidota bacterium]|nr:hypothetical protein [Bacteroidota bacterium]